MLLPTGGVPKDLMFKLRLDEADRARLNAVAAHYSAPAATAIRILIKQAHDQLPSEERAKLTPPTSKKPRK
jgi:hypothetical protein